MKILLWFRNDLRVHDHEALFKASQKTAQVFPLYVLDPRMFQEMPMGFPKTGNLRTQFLVESLENLRKNLQSIGSNLIIRIGHPEEIIPQLAKELLIDEVFVSEEVTSEETDTDTSVEVTLKKEGIKMKFFWQATLYHLDVLPMEIENLPNIFTQFRNQVEKATKVRSTFPIPKNLNFSNTINIGELPKLDFLKTNQQLYKGGEDEALKRLEEYFWQKDLLKVYKETRNGMLGLDYSSKFSLWLANGCISPKYIYEQVKKYEAERTQNDSTYWLIFELLWRDYFRFVALKYGNKIFFEKGIQGKEVVWKQHTSIFEKWRLGETGVPLIDANMKELLATGFMSNRGRQNVASFLVKDLQIDWRWGAAWFESQLIDYDVCSNWGNWLYVAGIGNDPRENRYFNILKQAHNYDPKGEYVKFWLPVLADVPAEKVHAVALLTAEEQRKYQVTIGVDYPKAIVDVRKWNIKK
ncbi:DASH family cryptochrome [Arcicella lustrica]|uniref:Cryptochrome DASH n=1 Tax=Arcicella lustrica TaxID=2984196 RepID=A0ABU5SEV2_9BACT|nr:DASH family cryptochrome [Arcicella sp. DC25W]MEA5425813.1 DASH family cryptochrome [Arcicella sp. DC25W]